jgi:DnaJ-class molecular chaperone
MTDEDFDDEECRECGKPIYACRCFECPTCHGRGTVNPLTAPQGYLAITTTTCPTCDGSGEV